MSKTCSPCDAIGEMSTAYVLGQKWTILITGELLTGPKRFSELQSRLGGISPRTLALRLRFLAREGFVERAASSQTPPRHKVYRLTSKGLALDPVLRAIRAFDRTWSPPTIPPS